MAPPAGRTDSPIHVKTPAVNRFIGQNYLLHRTEGQATFEGIRESSGFNRRSGRRKALTQKSEIRNPNSKWASFDSSSIRLRATQARSISLRDVRWGVV